VADLVLQLFEEYLERYAGGERPDLRAYLERAGEGRAELAALVDQFHQWAEPVDPDEDAVAVAQAWIEGEAPMVALRVRRGLTRASVVDAVMSRFKLAPDTRKKVERRYHELETGQLDVRRADPALLDELARVFKARVADLASWQPRPLRAEPAYFRAEAASETTQFVMPAPAAESDEVDRLFLGA
jgi:hypothetical protein